MNSAHSKGELRRVARALRARVEFDAASGANAYPRGRRGAASAGGVSEDVVERPAEVGKVTGESGDLFVSSRTAEVTSLEDLRAELGDCQRCKLAGHRTNIVFGVGNPRASLMFVGEGPGHDEDMQAEPFVGRAGQLLTEIITKGMGLGRADVYIANVIKCRPPGNRNPEPDEVAACQPFLQRQIELIRPAVLVALGTFAAQALLRTRAPISRLRGQWHDYHGIRLMPTFHPAYLLRNPHDKRVVWQDIKMVMQELGLRREVR
jgi:DNA polymerase